MNKIISIVALSIAAVSLTACSYTPSSDQIQNQKQEEISRQSVESVGLPAIKNFQEKRIMKDIIELRDQPNLVTYTYTQDMSGRLHKICDSVGYGLPYSTQYTNPERIASGFETPGTGNITLPQADPNGLYSPSSASGTLVLCKVPGKDSVKPIYIEPNVIVSPFPLNS